MCGIVGLYLKNPELESQLGALFTPMLSSMTERGPDSAGFAIYGDEVNENQIKITLQHEAADFDWDLLAKKLSETLKTEPVWFKNANAAVFKLETDEATARAAFASLAPDAIIMSVGKSIEILKQVVIT